MWMILTLMALTGAVLLLLKLFERHLQGQAGPWILAELSLNDRDAAGLPGLGQPSSRSKRDI